jgi:hypothetical protein
MSLNVSGLSAYTNENLIPLVKKSILGGRTTQFITVQPGIKSSANINTINSTINAAAGACGWSPSGSTVLGKSAISVCDIKINESICLNTLEDYYTQVAMRPGSYNTEIPFEQTFAEEKAGQVGALIDDLIWKGNTVTGVGNLALCNGFINAASASVSAASGVVLSAASGSLTAGNAIAAIDTMVAETPSAIMDQEDQAIFIGYDAYRVWAKALRDANLFHYTGAENQEDKFAQYVPGTNTKVIAVRGLTGTNVMMGSTLSNFYFGTDLLNDGEDFKIWYSEDNDEVRFLSKWKQGVAFAFNDLVVYHKA